VTRPSKDETFLEIARALARRSTCQRRAVGCVLVDARGQVLATGYNGVARGLPHCAHEEGGVARVCSGAGLPSGVGLDACEAVHAEQNALLQCPDVFAVHTAYVTTAPCVTCAKLFLNTGCRRVVYRDAYPQLEAARDLLARAGIELVAHK
jgi:dCMP deaminase